MKQDLKNKTKQLTKHEPGSSNMIPLRLNHQYPHLCVDVFLYVWKLNYFLRVRILRQVTEPK